MCPFQWEWAKGLCCVRIFKDAGKKRRNNKQEKGKEEQRKKLSSLLQGTEIQQLTNTEQVEQWPHLISTQGRVLWVVQQGVLGRHFKLLVKFSLVPPPSLISSVRALAFLF